MSPSTRRLVPALVAAVVLVVVLGILAVAGRGNDTDSAGAGSGGGGSGGSAGSGSSDGHTGQGGMAPPSAPGAEPGSDANSGADDPMTRFTDVRPGDGGSAVDVTFYGGVDTCYSYVVRADETARQVALSLSEQRKGDGPCIELAQEYVRSVPLERPLGDRRVVDAATGDVLLDPSG